MQVTLEQMMQFNKRFIISHLSVRLLVIILFVLILLLNNPSTDTLTAGNFVGDISQTTGGFLTGMIMMWGGTTAPRQS